ncbi:hypothetical protein NliqN6_6723 [Naganishia liquefaciens]|uniref:Mediator of RNA polymerase II transcription subunit 10 n=1 Tax=Naganishia liquefaciens TaxID=104408 RepID=A0A8H3U0H1_9TREE|nr:hypothetical protein NliqN6_6723 [Naganishia liquefaciens]
MTSSPALTPTTSQVNFADLQSQPPAQDPQAQLRRDVERKLLETCHLLFEMEITAGNVVPGREDAMIEITDQLTARYAELSALSAQSTDQVLGEALVEIDATRNPHFVTRKYLNAALGTNQFHNAKYEALTTYHDMLSTALGDAFPDMAEELSTLRPIREDKPEKEAETEPQAPPVKMED